MDVWLGKVWNVMEAPWTPKGMIQLQKILKLYEASVEDILDDMEMFIFDWPSTLLWYSDFLRFDDWKNPEFDKFGQIWTSVEMHFRLL